MFAGTPHGIDRRKKITTHQLFAIVIDETVPNLQSLNSLLCGHCVEE